MGEMFYKLGSVVDYCKTDNIIDVILTAIDDNELIEFLECEDEKLYFDITIGNCNWYKDNINTDDILEYLSNKCYEESGDLEIRNYLKNINQKNIYWLQEKLDELWKEFKEKAKIYSPFFTFSNEHDYRVYLEKVNEDYKVINYNEHYEILIDFSNNDSDLIIVSDKCNNFDNKLYISSTNDLYIYSLNERKFYKIKNQNIHCSSYKLRDIDLNTNKLVINEIICNDDNGNIICIAENNKLYVSGNKYGCDYECSNCIFKISL